MKKLARTLRQEIALAVMEHLNANHQSWSHYYDCGESGVLHIYWRSAWEIEWIDALEVLPDEVLQTALARHLL